MTNNLPTTTEYNKFLETLTEDERKIALQILDDFSHEGSSDLYNKLIYADYNEVPVDIETFLKDEQYLGKAWHDASGKFKMYDFWLDVLKKLFPTNIDTAFNTLLESGARGIGKSEVACGAVGPYLMYRVMCMKNPLDFYRLKPTEKICFAFMNIKLDLAEEIATSKFQNTIQASPWFMSRGTLTKKNNKPYWVPPDPVSIIIGSQSDDVIGLPVFWSFFDEISFIKNQDIDKQKKKAKDMIDTALGGMLTRFVYGGKNPTMLVVASSKRSEQSFMESYIKTLSETDGNNTFVVDKPVWEIKPKGTYSDETFKVGLGNKYLENVIIPEAEYEHLDQYQERGYKIIDVPVDFKAKFLQEIDRALCDYAGISSASSNKYMSAQSVGECVNKDFKNPLPDVLEIGNAKEDTAQYYNFFNLANVPQELMHKPLYIHLDMSISGDMTGIAGVWITGKKVSTDENQAKDLSFRLAFSTSIKAPKGHQISFEKNRNFIRWLKERGFKIKYISCDTYQSYDLLQQLKAEGYETGILSVDRVTDNICQPYQYLRSTIYERRFVMYKSDRLFDEFIDVERDLRTGKVDHSPNFHKDVLDAVCGATYTASKYAEQYAYDYGEDLDTMRSVSVNNNQAADTAEINKAFVEQLQNMFDPMKRIQNREAPTSSAPETSAKVNNEALIRKQQEQANAQKYAYMSQGILI